MLAIVPSSRSARLGAESTSAQITAASLLCLALVACGDSPADVDASCAVVGEISVGQTRQGQLSSSDCDDDGRLADRWRLTLGGQTTVRIDLRSSVFDAYLELRSESGTLIASNDDAYGFDSRIERTLAAATYILVARSFSSGETGSYHLSVTDRSACTSLGTLVMGEPVTGQLEGTDCPGDWNAPEDRWTLQLAQAQRLRLDLASAAFDEVLLIRDPQGYVLSGSDWNHPAGHARIEMQLAPGTWTVSATAAHETARGSYQLVVDAPPPCTPGIDLRLGETVEGVITQSDCLFQGAWAPADSFGIDVAAETAVRLHMKGVGFSPFLILRNAMGQDVATSFGQMPGSDARIRTSLPPGRYALFASGDHPYGAYSLVFDEDVCAEPQAVAFGGSITATLDADDCIRSGGHFQELWALALSGDATARIDLSSTAFDPYLILMDASGNVLESDDDDGPGYDARIERALSAGTYVIAASSYHPGATGPYTLSVGAAPASVGALAEDTPSGTKPEPGAGPVAARRFGPEPAWVSLLGGSRERTAKEVR